MNGISNFGISKWELSVALDQEDGLGYCVYPLHQSEGQNWNIEFIILMIFLDIVLTREISKWIELSLVPRTCSTTQNSGESNMLNVSMERENSVHVLTRNAKLIF